MNECDKYHGLLMGLMDGELTGDEASAVNGHLIRCAACRQEYDQLREVAAHLGAVSFREPTDEVLAALWKRPYTRWSWNAGLVLVIGGYAALLVYGLVCLFLAGPEGLGVAVPVAAVVIGMLILLIVAMRERLAVSRIDPYREVER